MAIKAQLTKITIITERLKNVWQVKENYPTSYIFYKNIIYPFSFKFYVNEREISDNVRLFEILRRCCTSTVAKSSRDLNSNII